MGGGGEDEGVFCEHCVGYPVVPEEAVYAIVVGCCVVEILVRDFPEAHAGLQLEIQATCGLLMSVTMMMMMMMITMMTMMSVTMMTMMLIMIA